MKRQRKLVTGMLAAAVGALMLPGVALANGPEGGIVPSVKSSEQSVAPAKISPIGIDANGSNLIPPNLPNLESELVARETAAYIPGAVGKMKQESVIGDDDRYRVSLTWLYPSSAVVYITQGGEHHCTGWMVSKDTLVTAGHCVFDPFSGGWYKDMVFYPGADDSEKPFGSARAVQIWSDTQFIQQDDSRFDWGIVKLDSDIGYLTGWFGMKAQTKPYLRTAANLRGYPGDKPAGQMWSATGFIQQSNPNQLCYAMDSIGGQSGSPVYNTFTLQVMAIHVHGVGYHGEGDCPRQYNAGTRITPDLLNLINGIK